MADNTKRGDRLPIKLSDLSRVPAYAQLLNRLKLKLEGSRWKYKNLPIVDKGNYIRKSKTEDLFIDRKLPPMIYASSGSSGQPTFWFRGDEQEKMGGEIHRIIIEKIFGIEKTETTLAVVCFSMGVWVAGNYTLASLRQVSRSGHQLSSISPGMEREDIFSILKILAPKFDNLIITGYPSFVMDIVTSALSQGIKFKNRKIRFITAGDKFSEEWREALCRLLKIKDTTSSVVGIYGSADAGAMGHETPLSVFLRQEALKNDDLYEDLFGATQIDMPGLIQYHPRFIKFEEVDQELALTTNSAAPLLKYNIHDTGKIVSYNDIKVLLKKHNLLSAAKKFGLEDWRLPFLVLNGRTDVAVTFYALNIYPEHIRQALAQPNVAQYVTGSFCAYNKTTDDQKTEKLYIELELKSGQEPGDSLSKSIGEAVAASLNEINIEYRKLYSTIGSRSIPEIILHLNGNFGVSTSKNRKVIYVNGKKPKVIDL